MPSRQICIAAWLHSPNDFVTGSRVESAELMRSRPPHTQLSADAWLLPKMSLPDPDEQMTLPPVFFLTDAN